MLRGTSRQLDEIEIFMDATNVMKASDITVVDAVDVVLDRVHLCR